VTWPFAEDKLTQFAPAGDGDPLGSFTAELEEIKAKAEEMTERLRAASATVRAPDGAVTVTVGARACIEVGQSHSLIAAMWTVAS
jgi:DNA-binding protein YbaB